jgi:subtilisin family serine protease
MNPRPILALLLCGVLLAAGSIGGSNSAAAFGMFGFGRGGFGRPAFGGGPLRRPPPPRLGGGRVAGRPPGGSGPRAGLGDGGPSRHHGIGGGIVGGGVGGGVVGGGNNGRGGAPSQGDRPFVPNEIITAFAPGTTPQAIDRVASRYDLTQLETQNFPLIGSGLYRWRIGGGRTVVNVVRALGSENIVASVQPNYFFTLQDQIAKSPAAKSPAGTPGDAAQYVLAKLQIEQAQQIATGKTVLIAVIDSEIDLKHPDLDGTIVKSFDAIGGGENPHPHGTSIAGAIASHGKLLGIAPGAQLLAVHAFDDTPGAAKGTSFAIDKGLQWAADNGARVVNMSFAGPADPTL